jgi:hypothetical protein
MPDANELLHSNLHEVFPNGTRNAGGQGLGTLHASLAPGGAL